MKYAEALAALIDQQDEADSTNVTISRIVGDMVDKATEGAINFGTFDNCREYGVTFGLGLWTFCVYEHRNSDEICIEGCPSDEVQSFGPYGGETKWDVLFTAGYEEYKVVADKLLDMLRLVSDGKPHVRAEVKRV